MTSDHRADCYLTITLTDRPPARILRRDWPLIASSEGPVGRRLYVRQHADGRTIVSGEAPDLPYRAGEVAVPRRAGELVEWSYGMTRAGLGAFVAGAIRRVGRRLECSPQAIEACISDLPAVEL